MKINNDYKNRQFSFKALPFRVERGIKLFEEFHTTPSKFCPRDYFVRICNDDYLPKGVSIRVDNENYTTIGVSDLTIMPKKVLFNDNMDVFSRSNRSQGAGTAMHLAGIMTMLENGLEKLKLFSLGQAVHFHSRFKFEPKIRELNELEDLVETNIVSHKGIGMVDDIAQRAEEWLFNDTGTNVRKRKIEGNKLLNEYLQMVLRNKYYEFDEFKVPLGFNMELTKKKILENADFFNKLFERFGIDYKIPVE